VSEVEMKSGLLKEFTQATETLVNAQVQDWKSRGGRVVGYFCSAVPEEIITAAGFLPFRMRATGSNSTELSDAYFSSINCSFPRHCFNLALRGEFTFLDGVICVNNCDNIRRIYDNWKRQLPDTFLQIMSLPRKTEEPQVNWYRDELANLKKNMEDHFGVKITDESLKEAIKLHNETRRLQRKVYELRKKSNPPISGAETLAVTVAGTAMPKKQYNEMLKKLSKDLSNSEGISNYRARLLLMGGILDNPAYIKVIEDQGGLVVTDSLCLGSRLLWVDVDEEKEEPLTALARYYVQNRPSCPRTFGDYERRIGFVKDMVKDFKVDGIILERLAFCDHWGFEQHTIENDLRESDIPCLILDREYILSGVGQLRTRVQAFLEKLGG
jgi:benzoyl-CoA reductase subunit C